LKKIKRALEVFRRRIAEELFEKLDDRFDLRTFQTASAAMQRLANIGRLISLANGFLRSGSQAGINGRFGLPNGKLGIGSGHGITHNSRGIERVFRANSNKAIGSP
jgi:hypothetical protein